MKKLQVLDLFSGTQSIAKSFREGGASNLYSGIR